MWNRPLGGAKHVQNNNNNKKTQHPRKRELKRQLDENAGKLGNRPLAPDVSGLEHTSINIVFLRNTGFLNRIVFNGLYQDQHPGRPYEEAESPCWTLFFLRSLSLGTTAIVCK